MIKEIKVQIAILFYLIDDEQVDREAKMKEKRKKGRRKGGNKGVNPQC